MHIHLTAVSSQECKNTKIWNVDALMNHDFRQSSIHTCWSQAQAQIQLDCVNLFDEKHNFKWRILLVLNITSDSLEAQKTWWRVKCSLSKNAHVLSLMDFWRWIAFLSLKEWSAGKDIRCRVVASEVAFHNSPQWPLRWWLFIYP